MNPSIRSNVSSCVITLVVITIYALSAQSCRSTKTIRQQVTTDSLRIAQKLTVVPATVPSSRATLTIRTDDLRNLPAGVNYTRRSGQASATIVRLNDTILVTAECDSLQRLVWHYETELTNVRNDTLQQLKQSKPSPSPLSWFLYGVMAGISVILIIHFLLSIRKISKT